MEESATVLVIGRDTTLNAELAETLGEAGYQVRYAENAQDGLYIVSRKGIGVVILAGDEDIRDDQSLCAVLRQVSYVPIIVLGHDDGPYAAAEFLEAGADAYLRCPPRMNELTARVHALLRRRWFNGGGQSGGSRSGVQQNAGSEASGDSLTPTEFRLLACLASAHGRVLSSNELTEGVWGEKAVTPDCLKFYIRRLREKLGLLLSTPVYVRNVRGVGYRLSGSG